jgi:two-component system response regulator ArlR
MTENAKRILVVEDSEMLRESLVDLLKCEGYVTLEAADGKEGFEMFSKLKPDLIISDILMPVCGGIELVKKILDSASPIPIILMSGYTNNGDFNEFKNSPYWKGFFDKPFDEPTLMKHIRTTLFP